jgi:hypothetical protein
MTSPILTVGLVTETSHDSGMHDLSAAFPTDYRLPGGPIGQSGDSDGGRHGRQAVTGSFISRAHDHFSVWRQRGGQVAAAGRAQQVWGG